MSIERFNRDLLTNMLEECSGSLKRSLNQHLLLSNQHRDANVRFQRAQQQGKQSEAYRLSIRLTCISGVITMYEEHMKRKATRLQRLKLCLQKLELKHETKSNNNDKPTNTTDTNTSQHQSMETTSSIKMKNVKDRTHADKLSLGSEKDDNVNTPSASNDQFGSAPSSVQQPDSSEKAPRDVHNPIKNNSPQPKPAVKRSADKLSGLSADNSNLTADDRNLQETCREQTDQNEELTTAVIHSPKRRKLTSYHSIAGVL